MAANHWRPGDLLGVLVERDDLRPAPVALEGVPSGPAPEIEYAVARGERKRVKSTVRAWPCFPERLSW